jgi:hypothetical protein
VDEKSDTGEINLAVYLFKATATLLWIANFVI